MTVLFVIAPIAGVASCKDTPTATIGITTGLETDAFTRSPAPTTIHRSTTSGLDNSITELSRATLPVDQLSLGDKSAGGTSARFGSSPTTTPARRS